MMRSKYCAQISNEDIGKTVTLCGWCDSQRDLGGLIFIDLRDRSGIVQLQFNESISKSALDVAFSVRNEFVLKATGVVKKRESKTNPNLKTGELEVCVSELEILSKSQTPPFDIASSQDVKEELRLKHRYLELRRKDMQESMLMRHQVAKYTRDYFDKNGFLEIETPILNKSTPEGARDYLVPSRVHKGSFYALPQSPQLYKQILMISGFDRYMQIAKCFRDEDLRADRQPEFTQIDLEMSFIDEEDIMSINEGYIKGLFKEILDVDVKTPFLRMPYAEAMDRFGSDKPDTRFGFELKNITEFTKNCGFGVFESCNEEGKSVRAINIKGYADKMSRKEIDSLGEFAKTYGAKGLAFARYTAEAISSSFLKFLNEDAKDKIFEATEFEKGDVLLVVADKDQVVFDTLGALRVEIAKRLDILDNSQYNFLWVTEFPLFEYSEEENRYVAKHHPFTCPMECDIDKLDTEKKDKLRARAYDIILNGCEIGGGSIRIHKQELQEKMFKALGLSIEEATEKFGFLLDAFKFGAPPHGGMAYGLDRLCMLMGKKSSIREVIAFPKVQNASELMSGCPSEVAKNQLEELGLQLKKD